MNKPKISIIIPMFNSQKYIKEALNSIFNQTRKDFEVIVVDDGSTDNSAEIVKTFKDVRYLYKENEGVASARNFGIQNAGGKYIVFLDADDYWAPDKLSKQIGFMEANNDYGFTFTNFKAFSEDGYVKRDTYLKDKVEGVASGTLAAKKEVFEKVGFFDTEFNIGEDTDWIIRAIDLKIKYTTLPAVLVFVRMHKDSLTAKENIINSNENILKAIKKSIIRRKKNDIELVSVIIPTFNSEKYIKDAIESVIAQTYPNLEIIISDDGSTDNTKEIVNNLNKKIIFIENKHVGVAHARNVGVERATGKYIAFLDSDDMWKKNKIYDQVKLLNENADIDMVFGHIKEFYSGETDERYKNTHKCFDEPRKGISPVTLLMKKSKFFEVGFFNEKIKIGEFIEWYSRATNKELKSMVLEETVTLRRLHYNNTTLVNKEDRKDYINIIKEIMKEKNHRI